MLTTHDNDCEWRIGHDCTCAPKSTAALSTPATEPQGYVEGRPDFVAAVMKRLRRFEEITDDVEGTGVDIGRDWLDVLTFLGLLVRVRKSPASWQLTDAAMQALAARPAPQPAADTRVVTVVQLEQIAAYCSACGLSWQAEKIRAIIGNATPAPSDKIAEAARVKPLVWENNTARDLYGDLYEIEGNGPFEIEHPRLFNAYYRFPSIDAAKDAAQADHEARVISALAGQGETP